jgi:hypothetical protein
VSYDGAIKCAIDCTYFEPYWSSDMGAYCCTIVDPYYAYRSAYDSTNRAANSSTNWTANTTAIWSAISSADDTAIGTTHGSTDVATFWKSNVSA